MVAVIFKVEVRDQRSEIRALLELRANADEDRGLKAVESTWWY